MYSFCIAYLLNMHISSIVVLFYLFDSPWTFVHFVCFIPSNKLILFIYPMYRIILLLHSSKFSISSVSYIFFTLPNYASFNIKPPIIAICVAASFPLGSIMPYIRAYKVKTSLFSRLAVVPIMLQAH